ncbi:MAG: adenosine deaminase [Acidobacteriota bacterium]|nr:MAG: adenosine deaminase [Acidobacteriota bacterium]
MKNIELAEFVRKLPKAEIHLHLEGSVTPGLLAGLASKYKTDLAGLSEDDLREQLFTYDDFYAFLNTYRQVCEHLKSPEDYLVILDHLEQYFLEQNILYAEIIYTPSIPDRFGRDGREVLDALLERAAQIEQNSGVKIRWILDNVRQFGSQAAEKTAELGIEMHPRGVVGIGVGGDEKSVPLGEFKAAFSWARAHQLFIHVHAGEIGGPEEVWEALQEVGANRIGHGIQSARDSKLVTYLRDRAVALDICLTSNAKTRAWPMVSSHPFPLLRNRGVPVTLNTDDPGLFETTLTKEYCLAADLFDLTEEHIQRLVLHAVQAAFLPHEERMDLMRVFLEKMQ